GAAAPRHERPHVAHRATHLHEQSIQMRAELVDAGVYSLLQLPTDAAQRMIAEVHAKELPLPAESLIGGRRRRAVAVLTFPYVDRDAGDLDLERRSAVETGCVSEQRGLPRLALAADDRRPIQRAIEVAQQHCPLAQHIARSALDERLQHAAVEIATRDAEAEVEQRVEWSARLTRLDDGLGHTLADVLDVLQPVENLAFRS